MISMRIRSNNRPPISQVFLDDVRVARGIAQALALPKGTRVLEIGPGKGALTSALLDEGFEVLAVERDERMRRELAGFTGLKLVIADALSFPLAKASQKGYVHLAGNLPYHITGMIMRKVFEASRSLKSAVFMIQNEVADRLVSSSGSERSLLTLAAELHCASRDKVFTVSPSSFKPQPKVQSGVIRLTFRDMALLDPAGEARFFIMLKAAFSQKRKTLHNTLADLAGGKKLSAEKLDAAGVDPKRRAETLTLDEAIKLAGLFS